MLHFHHIPDFQTHSGYTCHLDVSYRLFGLALGTAPIILVNHALTGNSKVTGPDGWWNDVIGKEKTIDTKHFTILAIDIPGNGHDGKESHLIRNYKQFNIADIARVQYEVLKKLEITKLFAVIGGSLGGQIAWELAVQHANLVEHLIPIATDWKATDWVIAQCRIQDQILNNSLQPINDARMHAMTFYRTPASFKAKFNRTKRDNETYNIESWLLYHGKKLSERFTLSAYKLMNQLLLSADITAGVTSLKNIAPYIKCQVHLVSIDTDGLFLANEMYDTYNVLKDAGVQTTYNEITSIHGHDAFLIEYDQLSEILKPIFKKELCHK